MISRIRIIDTEGRAHIRDLAFSQLTSITKELSREDYRAFLSKEPVDVPGIGNIKLVRDDL